MCGEGGGVWRLAFGVWRLAVGVWRLAVGGWRLAVGGWRISSIVIVLVLEKGAQVSAKLIDPDGVAAPQIGGEPLLMLQALSVGSRRLPGITQRDILPNAAV